MQDLRMIRLETIRKFRSPFGICIAFSVLAVIGCDLFCNLGLISFSFPRPQTVVVLSSHTHGDGDHHHGREGHHSRDQHASSNHKSSEDKGCCNDRTQQFYSSLVNATNAQISFVHAEVFKLISTLIQCDLIEHNLLSTLSFSSKFAHKPNGPPGITGHVIRVLFCSFII